MHDDPFGTYGDIRLDLMSDPEGFRVLITRHGEQRSLFVSNVGSGEPTVIPVVPDRPVVFVPRVPISVLPQAVFTVAPVVPVWLRILGPGRGRETHTIEEVPSVIQKKTWSGSAENGEPAYLLEYDNESEAPAAYGRHEFRVPIEIRNSSGAILIVERLVVRVVHLDLFLQNERLRTNGITYDFRGKDQESRISFERSAHVERAGGVKISSARLNVSTDIIKKSFYWIRDLAV